MPVGVFFFSPPRSSAHLALTALRQADILYHLLSYGPRSQGTYAPYGICHCGAYVWPAPLSPRLGHGLCGVGATELQSAGGCEPSPSRERCPSIARPPLQREDADRGPTRRNEAGAADSWQRRTAWSPPT